MQPKHPDRDMMRHDLLDPARHRMRRPDRAPVSNALAVHDAAPTILVANALMSPRGACVRTGTPVIGSRRSRDNMKSRGPIPPMSVT